MNATTRGPWRVSKTATLWWQEAWATVTLAMPLTLIVLSHMAMLTTDLVMMGWLGPDTLAAGKLAVHFYNTIEFFAIGVIDAVSPILSQHLGARRYRMVRRTFRQGAWVAVILAVPCTFIIWHTKSILGLLGQDPGLALAGQPYVRFMVLGFLPGLWLLVLSRLLSAHLRPRATLVVTVVGIGVNALADYALMFGQFGFPRMGLTGAGIATALVTTLMFLTLLTFVLLDRRLRRYRLLGRFWRADWSQISEILRLGLPIGFVHLAEVGMFLAATLLMGLIGTATLAAHAIANQSSAIVYMVPYGLAQAATVRVGRAMGAANAEAVKRAGRTALTLGIGFAILPAMAFWFAGGTIADIFLDRAQFDSKTATDLAISFLAIAAFLHFADCAHRIALGALRGLKDTRGPMLISLAGYWGLGLPLAAVFGVYLGFGGQAIWLSMTLAVSLVGVILVRRFFVRSLQAIEEMPQAA